MNRKLFRDIAERVAASALFAGVSVLVTAEGDKIFDPNVWRIVLAAVVGAALSTLKAVVASHVGDKDSAALLPAPTPAG